jgi:hypothetical protein
MDIPCWDIFSSLDISPSPYLTLKTSVGAKEILKSCNSQQGLELHPSIICNCLTKNMREKCPVEEMSGQ